jgi:TIR domain
VDVTLKQFSLPRTNEWSGSKAAYVLQMTNDAPDQTLVDLARHVGFEIEDGSAPTIDPPYWRKGMLRVFVSHLATERVFAGRLQEALLEFAISTFIAHNDIEPTQEWQIQIETALATCDALVALLHDGFHESKWTDQEIGFAMGRGVPTFSVRCGQDPYGFIGRFQAFNGHKKSAAALARELFDAYRRNKLTQRRMGEVIIGLFEESSSFAAAKERIGYIEELDTWQAEFSKRIRSAAKANSQISGSWGVPDRVTAVIKKWA